MKFPDDYPIETKEKIIFEEVDGLTKHCFFCGKKIRHFYNDDYEIFIDICGNLKCQKIYRLFDMDYGIIDVDLDKVELENYYES